MRRWLSRLDDALLVAVLAVGGWFGYERAVSNDPPPAVERSAREGDTPPAPATALDLLRALPVKGKAPMTGYDRDEFGRGWQPDRGCDARNRTLQRDLIDVETRPGTNGCVVIAGVLVDPYSGSKITFDKQSAGEVPIDHVVALADAWTKGALVWTLEQRTTFANDPLNLLAISRAQNSQKREHDASGWLPKARSFRCEYVARQVAVKAKYGLWVTQPERNAIIQVLDRCPRQRLPT